LLNIGTILYLNPFHFKNGATPKNKYFIILKSVDSKIIIASLPTSICKAPSLINHSHGCNHDPERCFNCFAFEAGKVVCTNGFAFPLPTFMYGNEVEEYEIDKLNFDHKIEGVDYEIKGQLTESDSLEILNCLKQSASIRRGVKKHL